MTLLSRESDSTRGAGDGPSSLESSGEAVIRFLDLTDAALRARACHPAYAARIRFPVHPAEPAWPAAENW